MLVKRRLRGESLSKSNEEEPERCLSDEDLAAFQDGSVTGKALERIVGHLARCRRCRTILEDSIKSERRVPDPSNSRNSAR